MGFNNDFMLDDELGVVETRKGLGYAVEPALGAVLAYAAKSDSKGYLRLFHSVPL